VEEYQALLASNFEEYERLSRMIDNTLFLARVDNAQLALKRETLDLRPSCSASTTILNSSPRTWACA
jgi:signal transduction histidine kinase